MNWPDLLLGAIIGVTVALCMQADRWARVRREMDECQKIVDRMLEQMKGRGK